MQQSREGASEDGFTLVELLIYSMLSVVILGMVATLLINSLNTEKDVRAITTATNQGQVVADSIETGVRSSSDIQVLTIGSDKVLLARTAGGGASISWQCAAWHYSAALKEIRYRSSPTQIAAPDANTLKTWTLLAAGIVPTGTDPVFNEATAGELSLSFSSDTAGNAPVAIRSTAVSRADPLVGSPCF